jgi:phospholipid transport system substrate-binding protein
MMSRLPKVAAIVVFAALCPVGGPRAQAAPDAVAFVSTLGTQAIQVLGPQVSEQRRLTRFRELFRDDFDVPRIGAFVLGRYWRTATPQQRQEFLRLFQEYIVEAYSARLGQYGGEPFRVTGSRAAGEEIIVTSQVIRQNGAPVEVDWYLVDEGGRLKIIDVYVGGISMKVTERDEFGSIIQRNGGSVEPLLAALRQKVGAAQ